MKTEIAAGKPPKQAVAIAYNTERQSDAVTAKERVRTALIHPNKLGAGARKREHLNAPEKKEAVMKEYSKGTLHSGSGAIVKSPKQAMAIGYAEAGEHKKKQSHKDKMAADRIKTKTDMHNLRAENKAHMYT